MANKNTSVKKYGVSQEQGASVPVGSRYSSIISEFINKADLRNIIGKDQAPSVGSLPVISSSDVRSAKVK